MQRMRRADSADAPDVILDLESPAKASRRAKSLRDVGATIMQDTNAFQGEEQQPDSPKASKPQYPMRAQVWYSLHSCNWFSCTSEKCWHTVVLSWYKRMNVT